MSAAIRAAIRSFVEPSLTTISIGVSKAGQAWSPRRVGDADVDGDAAAVASSVGGGGVRAQTELCAGGLRVEAAVVAPPGLGPRQGRRDERVRGDPCAEQDLVDDAVTVDQQDTARRAAGSSKGGSSVLKP